MNKYKKLLERLSPAFRLIQEQQLEFIRNSLFGGDDDEYGQRVFNEKLIKSLEKSKPKEITFYYENLEEISKLLNVSANQIDLFTVQSVYSKVNLTISELRDRMFAIRDFNYYRTDELNFTNGSMPAKEGLTLLEMIRSKLLFFVIDLDEGIESSYIGKSDKPILQNVWLEVRYIFSEFMNFYTLIVFYEILYFSFENSLYSSERVNDVLKNLWDELSVVLNSGYIHFIYIETRPIAYDKEPEYRITSDRPTRIKIFFSNDQKLFQLRLDFSHEGENFFHGNLHVSDMNSESFREDHTFQFSDIQNVNNEDENLKEVFKEIENGLMSIKLKNRNKKNQERNERDGDILDLVKIQIYKKNLIDLGKKQLNLTDEEIQKAVGFISRFSNIVAQEDISLIYSSDKYYILDLLMSIEITILETL
ncbi:hypothetical protein [Leptospira sp. GIMC2001]|uniref:hypothetical protein n=1 Tax=Leptospira sp. GIMC2001 TaxID=1513297 RepID=UPI00234B6FE1|nr:hypothetical protein [Leptospira sp. GIMC2001]WCL50687.1 hypothetical protein O4O04_07720 [Leptospira sp. GIMC2001]